MNKKKQSKIKFLIEVKNADLSIIIISNNPYMRFLFFSGNHKKTNKTILKCKNKKPKPLKFHNYFLSKNI